MSIVFLLILSSHQPCRVTALPFVLELRKLGLKEAEYLAQGHTGQSSSRPLCHPSSAQYGGSSSPKGKSLGCVPRPKLPSWA